MASYPSQKVKHLQIGLSPRGAPSSSLVIVDLFLLSNNACLDQLYISCKASIFLFEFYFEINVSSKSIQDGIWFNALSVFVTLRILTVFLASDRDSATYHHSTYVSIFALLKYMERCRIYCIQHSRLFINCSW